MTVIFIKKCIGYCNWMKIETFGWRKWRRLHKIAPRIDRTSELSQLSSFGASSSARSDQTFEWFETCFVSQDKRQSPFSWDKRANKILRLAETHGSIIAFIKRHLRNERILWIKKQKKEKSRKSGIVQGKSGEKIPLFVFSNSNWFDVFRAYKFSFGNIDVEEFYKTWIWQTHLFLQIGKFEKYNNLKFRILLRLTWKLMCTSSSFL